MSDRFISTASLGETLTLIGINPSTGNALLRVEGARYPTHVQVRALNPNPNYQPQPA